uniref:Uncharacterized protein n=1 Tax=Arundo donax TaxID=35708 RepID=A0A0A9C2C3_ARUDO
MKTAQNWPHRNNSSVFWRKMLSESSITTRSYETKLHAYSLFKVSLNRMLKFSCFSYGFFKFSTETTFTPSSFSAWTQRGGTSRDAITMRSAAALRRPSDRIMTRVAT